MSRPQPVVEFTTRFDQLDEKTRQVVDVLRASSGKLTPVLDIAHLLLRAGDTVVAGATVTLDGTYVSLDMMDANIDSARLIVRGKTAAAGPIVVNLLDVTNSVILATVSVTTSLATQVGTWASFAAKAGERVLAIQIVGDSANAQTMYAIHSQYYTQRFLG